MRRRAISMNEASRLPDQSRFGRLSLTRADPWAQRSVHHVWDLLVSSLWAFPGPPLADARHRTPAEVLHPPPTVSLRRLRVAGVVPPRGSRAATLAADATTGPLNGAIWSGHQNLVATHAKIHPDTANDAYGQRCRSWSALTAGSGIPASTATGDIHQARRSGWAAGPSQNRALRSETRRRRLTQLLSSAHLAGTTRSDPNRGPFTGLARLKAHP